MYAYIWKTKPRYDFSSLAIRTLDGSVVRHKFNATDTLGDVRQYIEQALPGIRSFNMIQPLPHRTFTASDELQSLKDLDLVPSGSITLKSARNTSTFSGSTAVVRTRVFSAEWVSAAISTVLAPVWTVWAFLASFVGIGGSSGGGAGSASSSSSSASASGGARQTGKSPKNTRRRIRTLHDYSDDSQDDSDRRPTYNGNSTNQE
ncbi:hypothetical protein HK104_000713 [Borealophlyctis nickersoniae]|nr:hypothetical protein HK104_000713 [Borealophlyctis nickersoniae]